MNRTEYQKNYYLNVTKRNRELNKIKKENTLTNFQSNLLYKKSIIKEFNQYDFNNFFTGTSNPNYQIKKQLEKENKELKDIENEFKIELGLKYYKPLGLAGLTKKTNNYINHLLQLNIIDRALFFFETNYSNEWHTHIFLNVTNDLIVDLNNYLEGKWFDAISLNVPIKTKESQTKILGYCLKQIDIYSNKKTSKDKVLNWNFTGNYNKNNMETLTQQTKIAMLKAYKINHKLIVKVDLEQQKKLNGKYVTTAA